MPYLTNVSIHLLLHLATYLYRCFILSLPWRFVYGSQGFKRKNRSGGHGFWDCSSGGHRPLCHKM